MHFPRTVVMFPQVTWYADTGGYRHKPTPAGLAAPGRWARIVTTYAAKWDGGRHDAVIVVNPRVPLTPAERARATAGFLEDLQAAGWRSNSIGAETGWFTCRHRTAPGTIMFGVLPWFDQSRTTLFRLDDPADLIARRLAWYHTVLGVTWRGTGGLSGTTLLRSLHVRRQPRWRWDRIPDDVHGRSFELLGAHHHRTPEDDDGGFVHVYDTRAMYLAAALVAELAWDAPQQRGAQEFDPKRPGYWRVRLDDLHRAPQSESWVRLFARDQGDAAGLVWLTTPVMRYLTEALGPIEVHDSVTADQGSRIMRGWAERLRDARTAVEGDDALTAPVKDTYARTIGMLRKTSGRVYRPDWRDTIVDLAKVNLLRKVSAAGVKPLRYNVDAVWVPSRHETADPALFGDQGRIGGLRHVYTETIEAYRSKYETTEVAA